MHDIGAQLERIERHQETLADLYREQNEFLARLSDNLERLAKVEAERAKNLEGLATTAEVREMLKQLMRAKP